MRGRRPGQRFVGKDVAERVGRDVEALRVAHQPHREGVDDDVVDAPVGVFGGEHLHSSTNIPQLNLNTVSLCT
jgi:hypothetical protein